MNISDKILKIAISFRKYKELVHELKTRLKLAIKFGRAVLTLQIKLQPSI